MIDTNRVLATDLDGTLIPLENNSRNQADLATLSTLLTRHNVPLIYVTGRHVQSALEAMKQYALPRPQWVICDVGTTMYHAVQDGEYSMVDSYQHHLQEMTSEFSNERVRAVLQHLDGLKLQQAEKQARFKLSFYSDANDNDELVVAIERKLQSVNAPWHVIASVDPFNGDGLIDLLPKSVSKSFALAWWVKHFGRSSDAVVFAGDSGNDLAALTAGYQSIVVGNADRRLATEVERQHQQRHWTGRLHLATAHATSGVLEGCRAFGLFGDSHEVTPAHS